MVLRKVVLLLKLILVRHGNTAFNTEHRLTGQLDVCLSSIGELQAQAIATHLADEKINAILSSPLQRAIQTAHPIAQRLNKTLQIVPWLAERNCGVLEGLTKTEMKARHPHSRKAYKNPHLNLPISGNGESANQFSRRVADGMHSLSRQYAGQSIIAVCHGGVVREVFNEVYGTTQNGDQLISANASISIFRFKDNHWRMLSWGDVSHLHHSNTDQNKAGL